MRDVALECRATLQWIVRVLCGPSNDWQRQWTKKITYAELLVRVERLRGENRAREEIARNAKEPRFYIPFAVDSSLPADRAYFVDRSVAGTLTGGPPESINIYQLVSDELKKMRLDEPGFAGMQWAEQFARAMRRVRNNLEYERHGTSWTPPSPNP